MNKFRKYFVSYYFLLILPMSWMYDINTKRNKFRFFLEANCVRAQFLVNFYQKRISSLIISEINNKTYSYEN